MSKVFTIIPWDTNFLNALADELASAPAAFRSKELAKATVIFPHNRPQRYLTAVLRNDKRFSRPLLLPAWHTVSGLFSTISQSITQIPRLEASPLDRIGLLLSLLQNHPDLKKFSLARNESIFSTFPESGINQQHFFPWGLRLADLFEECFIHAKTPHNFLYGEGNVTPFASLLLENLGTLFSLYIKALEEKSWTTPGYDAYLAARYIQEEKILPHTLFRGGKIIIAGFFSLTGTEDILFKHLWFAHDAQVFLHADPALATNNAMLHESCFPLRLWAQSWGAEFTLPIINNALAVHDAASGNPNITEKQLSFVVTDNAEPHGFEKKISYVQGFDLHSQLTALQDSLKETPVFITDNTASTVVPDNELDVVMNNYAADMAVVLPESGLLMPTLHHLPHTDINISMGYPLSRSPFFRLLDTIFKLQESRRGKGYYWKDLIELTRHPYLKMLALPHDTVDPLTDEPYTNNSTLNLRREMHRFEQALRSNNSSFVRPDELIDALYATTPTKELPNPLILRLLQELIFTTLTGFEAPGTTADLAESMKRLCHLLLRYGMPLWKRFPIDAECLFRVTRSLIPELHGSIMAHEPLPSEVIFTIARQLLKRERVPFDAAPLVGLQVLGILETRLLSFRKIFILDATDSNLPGITGEDPLFPEALRTELGLPDLKSREKTASYHFFRLLAGAEETTIFWQEGDETGGLHEGRKKKSRFVEALLWHEEKKQEALLTEMKGPLITLTSQASPMQTHPSSIPVTTEIKHLINALLKKPVSASLLDAYIRCPVRFFYERLLQLTPIEEVTEDSDPLVVGTLLHTALHEFYEPLIGHSLQNTPEFVKNALPDLLAIFHAQPEFLDFGRTIPADSFAMLRSAGDIRLERFLHAQPTTFVVALEHTFSAQYTIFDTIISLTGTADRIDLRHNEMIILDYKTGRLPDYTTNIWKLTAFWEKVSCWTPSISGTVAHDPLYMMAKNMPSIQLPFYLYLLYVNKHSGFLASIPAAHDAAQLNAAWVALATDGKEYPLFHPNAEPYDRKEIVTKRIPELIHFLISHMARTPVLFPLPGKHCQWCPAVAACYKSANK